MCNNNNIYIVREKIRKLIGFYRTYQKEVKYHYN
jgi:hypothetical protein